MNLWIIVCSILVGLARGFRLDDFLGYRFRGLGWFALSLGVQRFIGTSFAERTPWLWAWAPLLHLCSMGMLLLAVWANRDLRGALLCGLGVLCNTAVIFANGGKMPVSLDALYGVGIPPSTIAYLVGRRSLTHRLLRPGTNLPWMADVLYLPWPFRRSPVFSVGDVILAVGLFILVQNMITRSARERENTALR